MTQNDLIVVVPWIIFCIGLLLLCVRLYRSRRSGDARQSNADQGNGEQLQQRNHDVPS